MNHWIYPANVKFYDVIGAFNAPGTYWPINSKISIEDVIYIYLAAPYKQIGFVCDVIEIDLEQNNILEYIGPFIKVENGDKKQTKLFMKLKTSSTIILDSNCKLSYDYLKLNGLNGMLMGPRKLENNLQLLEYIQRSL